MSGSIHGTMNRLILAKVVSEPQIYKFTYWVYCHHDVIQYQLKVNLYFFDLMTDT